MKNAPLVFIKSMHGRLRLICIILCHVDLYHNESWGFRDDDIFGCNMCRM